mgnify:CR=1 FL=1
MTETTSVLEDERGVEQGALDNKKRIFAIVGTSSGNLVEWFDFYVYSFCSIYFAASFFPAGNSTTQLLQTAGVFAAGFFMRPIGGWLFGYIADKHGRKNSMLLSVCMMCAGSLVIACLPTYESIGSWAPALLLIVCGLACVNVAELRGNALPVDGWRYLSGLGLAVLAVACWTWFPLRNSRWLRENPTQRPATWATAQGLVTLPLALLGYLAVCGQLALSEPAFALPFGPRPEVFIPLMLVIGVFCSWLGALCWNEASQRLPTVLVGPLIVFEILAGLAYTFLLRQAWPPLLTLAGIVCLIAGVVYAMRIKPQPVVVALEDKQG